jgi:hypothetical protein
MIIVVAPARLAVLRVLAGRPSRTWVGDRSSSPGTIPGHLARPTIVVPSSSISGHPAFIEIKSMKCVCLSSLPKCGTG